MKTAVAYLRAKDAVEFIRGTINNQLRAAQAYCAANGYTLIKVFQDVSENEPLKRKGYQEMLKYVSPRRKTIDLIIVETNSRISYNGNHIYDFENWACEQIEVAVVYTIIFPEIMRCDIPYTSRWIELN